MSDPIAKQGNPHERIAVGVLLAMIGGFLDAYSYALKGGVFANAQTGNLVLLCLAFARGDYGRIPRYVAPILTFAGGIFLSELLKGAKSLSGVARIKLVIAAEACLILGIGAFGDRLSDYFVNCVISFIAAVQVANFDRVRGNQIATTMITGNLRSAMTQLSRYVSTGDATHLNAFANYLVIILFFGLGVALGSATIALLAGRSILICLGLLFAVYLVVTRRGGKTEG